MNYFNIKRYKFYAALKKLNVLGLNFSKIFKYLDPRRYNLKKHFKIINFDFIKSTKYLNLKPYDIGKIKKIGLINNKFLVWHLPLAIIFFGFLYLGIPSFYKYDKLNLEDKICKNYDLKCTIEGKINYSFFPSPRLKIKNVIISSSYEKKNNLLEVKNVTIKLSIKNLLAKEKHKFKAIEFKNFESEINLKNLKQYRKILKNKLTSIKFNFIKGKILLYENKNYIATISNVDSNLKFSDIFIKGNLKGKFLNDNLNINFKIKENIDKYSTDIDIKMSDLNLFTELNFFNLKKEKSVTNGNFLIRKDKNKITGIFDYKENELNIKKSNLRNNFVDGKLEGTITFLPFFNFNLEANLNGINFTKLYTYFLSLNKEDKKKLFAINEKINGKLNISSDKVYSKHNLVKSFESQIKFYNSNIKIEQFLISLGKLGAADLTGAINNNKKFTNLKFESNIFVDNQKKFLSKFGIYNKDKVPSDLFVSGGLNMDSAKAIFYEISNNKKFKKEEVDYIETEFNNLMLEDRFVDLFNFQKFKVFLKSVMSLKN
jgi:hypothetical protein